MLAIQRLIVPEVGEGFVPIEQRLITEGVLEAGDPRQRVLKDDIFTCSVALFNTIVQLGCALSFLLLVHL